MLIATTGWGQDEDKRLSAEAGFDHHFVKPVDPDRAAEAAGDATAASVVCTPRLLHAGRKSRMWAGPFPGGIRRALSAELPRPRSPIALAAGAQDYPTRPIKIIVPFSPGGAVDGPTRMVASELAKRLNQGVVVENRPGRRCHHRQRGGGEVAAPTATRCCSPRRPTRSAPRSTRSSTSSRSTTSRPSGSSRASPACWSCIRRSPRRSVGGADRAGEGEARARSTTRPRATAAASISSRRMFATMAGIKLTHVPYKGSGQATTDLLGGVVPVSFPGLAGMLGPHQGRQAARARGHRRAGARPRCPTCRRSRRRACPATRPTCGWGCWRRRARPRRSSSACTRSCRGARDPRGEDLHGPSLARGCIGSTPAQFDAFFREERDRWAKIIRETGAKVD